MKAQSIVFAVCVAACVVAQVAILKSVIRARSVAPDPAVPRPRLLVEVAWALIPAIALAVVFTATWARVQERSDAPPPSLLMRIAQ